MRHRRKQYRKKYSVAFEDMPPPEERPEILYSKHNFMPSMTPKQRLAAIRHRLRQLPLSALSLCSPVPLSHS